MAPFVDSHTPQRARALDYVLCTFETSLQARPLGDPDSTYWKPEPQHAGVEGLTLQP